MNIKKAGSIALLGAVNGSVFLSLWNELAKGKQAIAVAEMCLLVLINLFFWFRNSN